MTPEDIGYHRRVLPFGHPYKSIILNSYLQNQWIQDY